MIVSLRGGVFARWLLNPIINQEDLSEMATLGVFLDGNVWNFLFERRLDLAVELPRPEFSIGHTREAEFEIPTGKPDLDAFFEETIVRCEIATDSYFGFSNSAVPRNEQ